MSDEIAEFAQGLAPAEQQPAPEPVQAAETQPIPTQEPQPEAPQAPTPAPPPEPQPQAAQPGVVPLEAMLSEREKRQALERRLAELEAAQKQPVQAPSVYDDPEAFQAYQQQQIAAVERRVNTNASYRFAERQYGKDTVEEAARWYSEEYSRTDPTAIQRLQADADPFELVVRQFRQQQLLSKLGDAPDLDSWFEKQAAERGFVKADAVPAAPLQTAPQAAPAPKSINGAPSAGGAQIVPTGPLAAFEALPLRN